MVTSIDDPSIRLAQFRGRHRILSESLAIGFAVLLDAFIIIATGLVIYALYVEPDPGATVRYTTILVIAAVLMVQSFYVAGLYRFSAIIAPHEQLGKIILILITVFLILVAVGFSLKIAGDYSRVWLFSTAIAAIILLRLGRGGFVAIMRRMAKKGYLARNILIYGATEQAQRFLADVRQLNAPWNRVVGLFDDRRSSASVEIESVRVRGDLQELIKFARDTRADDIIVALPLSNQRRISQILQQLKILPANISLCPDLATLRILSGKLNYQYGAPLASVYEKPLSLWHNVEKRLFDSIVSSVALLMLAPVMLVLFILIKLDSPGPIFFRQRRYGFNNELICIWKMRTMYIEQQDENAERLATPDDPRVTRFGSFLRRTSLDELPQLFNVIAGDMSLVGPRPHALRAKAAGQLYQDVVGEYAARHRVKPGLTGWAQVNGWRGETDTHEKIIKRVEHDLYYIEHWSVRLDLQILIRTVGVLLSQENAY